MTPFQTFRLWSRRGRTDERIATAVASAVVLALLVWLVIPGGKSATTSLSSDSGTDVGATPGTTAPSATSAGPANPAGGPVAPSGALAPTRTTVAGGGSTTGGGARATGSGNRTTTTRSGCVSPPGTAPGVTASTIKVAVALTNIFGPAANSQFGIPPVEDQQAYYQASADAINAAGGIACRKLVVQYFPVNPADSSDMQSKCLAVVESKPLTLIDGGGAAGQAGQGALCYAQHKVPFMGGLNYLTQGQVTKYFPYLFSLLTYDSVDHNAYFALKDRGFFSASNGFGKLGLLHSSCSPDAGPNALKWLKQAGVPASKIVKYDFGCPTSPPVSDFQQAVLEFQRSGVTHITMAELSNSVYYFAKVAEQQQYRPKYGLPDENLISTAYGGTVTPDPNNMDGAIVITAGRFGEEHTPGMRPNAATKRCDAIHHKRQQPTSWQQILIGNSCNQFWMLKAAVEHAPTISRTSLAPGLEAARSVDFSYPMGPNDFSLSRGTTAGQYWRTTQYFKSCKCYRVIENTFHPSYSYS